MTNIVVFEALAYVAANLFTGLSMPADVHHPATFA